MFLGRFDGDPAPDPAEVDDWQWIAPADLVRQVRERPDRFTYWFLIALRELQARGLP